MGDDYVNYTLLQKKGILKLKEEKLKSSLRNEGGFIDLTPFRNEVASEQATPQTSAPVNTSNFGFLSDMASIGSSNTPSESAVESTNASESGLSELRIKIDNMEYKIDRFLERIDKLEESLKNSK